MNNVRETLIAEALGDLGTLLDRIDAVVPLLTTTSETVTGAAASLAAGATAAEARVASFTDHATAQAIKRVAARAGELARNAADVETKAMQQAARTLFREELVPALQRLQRVLDARADRLESLSGGWWTHALTAAGSSAATWLIALAVLTHH